MWLSRQIYFEVYTLLSLEEAHAQFIKMIINNKHRKHESASSRLTVGHEANMKPMTILCHFFAPF